MNRIVLVALSLAALGVIAFAEDEPPKKADLPGWTRVFDQAMHSQSLAFSPDGATVFVADLDHVSAIDPATGALRSRIAARSTSIAPLSDGSLLGMDGEALVDLIPAGKGKPRRVTVGKGGLDKIVVAPDESRAVVLGERVAVLVSLAGGGKVEHRLAGHDSIINAAAFSADGATLVTADQRGRLIVHGVKAGNTVRTLERADACYSGVAYLDENRLVTTDFNANICVWDLAKGEVVETIAGRQKMQTMAYSAKAGLLATGGWNRVLRLYDVRDWSVAGELEMTDLVSSVAFNPAGDRLIMGWGLLAGGLVGFARGDAAAVPAPAAAGGAFAGTLPFGGTGALAFSGDGKTLYVGDTSDLQAYDVSRGVPTSRHVGAKAILLEREPFVAAKGDHVVVVEQKKVKELDGEGKEIAAVALDAGGAIDSIAASPDGAIVAVAGEVGGAAAVEVIDIGKKKSLAVFTVPQATRRSPLAVSPDGARVAVGLKGAVEVWDVKKKKLAGSFKGDGSVAVAFTGAKGEMLYGVGESEVTRTNLKTGAKAGSLKLSTTPRKAAVAPDGKRVASVDLAGTVTVMDLASGKAILTEHRVAALQVNQVDQIGIAFSPDGKRVAVSSSENKATRVLALP